MIANEIIFLLHVLLVTGFCFASLRIGPNGLISLLALQAVFANLFIVKQISLFGLEVTCSDVFAVGSLLCLNLLQEFYGREQAQKGVGISLVAVLFFLSMSLLHLSYLPSSFDTAHPAFSSILSPAPRIALASIAVFLFVQQLDLRVFSLLKQKIPLKLPLRLGISLALAQTVDTVLFSYLGLYGLVASVFDIIAVSLAIKWIAIGCFAPLTALARKFARSP